MVFPKEPVVLPQRIMACDGWGLNQKLRGWLKSESTQEITIAVYRYHDLDWNVGRLALNEQSGLINDLAKAADRGVKLTFVTRDPLTDGAETLQGRAITIWYRGLSKLAAMDGTRVMIHNSLHAKVYLAKGVGNRFFYAVGSSNLTSPGMGFRWVECNVLGYTQSEYQEVEKQVGSIINSRGILDLAAWKLKVSKNIANATFLTYLA